ncbi:MAG: hypothetical protein DWQ08_02355 [Proteobacteria bacterium]|nr:MAG: hypothetical protein DWQ08_02355 [Pseudomonadota bacterium]
MKNVSSIPRAPRGVSGRMRRFNAFDAATTGTRRGSFGRRESADYPTEFESNRPSRRIRDKRLVKSSIQK